jgi:cytochrome P450
MELERCVFWNLSKLCAQPSQRTQFITTQSFAIISSSLHPQRQDLFSTTGIMADSKVSLVFYVVFSAFGLATLHLIVQKVLVSITRSQFKKANNCQPVTKYPHKDPIFGYDYWRSLNKAAESHTLLHWIREQYRLYGNTYYARLHTTNVISTCDPENLKAMHSTNFKDFAIDSRRKLAFLPLLGLHSVLLANGAAWEHKRAMLRPSFGRDQYTNLPLFERHVGHLIQALKAENARAGQVDLAEFFLCLTVDITSELMYGTSIELLTNENKDLVRDMTQSAEGGHARWLLVFLAKIIGNPTFNNSVSRVRTFMKRFVDEAISYREHYGSKSISLKAVPRKWKGEQGAESFNRVIYLQQLALATTDRKAVLDELTTILFAGRDTTAALLTNLFFILAQRPDIYAKLRAEICILDGEKPTFEQLKGFTYLQSCLNEGMWNPLNFSLITIQRFPY